MDEYSTSTQQFRATMQTFVEHEMFDMLASQLYPNLPKEELKQRLLALEGVDQFQSMFMYRGCQWVIEHTMSRFTYSGTEYLDHTPRLFVSNHRDIVLDAMMLQYILVDKGLPTTHVIIGANLFEIPIMPVLAQLNKMYSIGRGGNGREYYRCLTEMSHHLRHWVVERGESAWIAQRNGRTKDGIDHTDPSLVKMIASSGNTDNPLRTLAEMNITPVSVSYEWEPCAALKARELCLRSRANALGQAYAKAPGEDMQSVLSGITDFKGHVHFTICQPIGYDELAQSIPTPHSKAEEKACYQAVAALIDRRITNGYHATPNNHIATQMLNGTASDHTPERQAFEAYVDQACRQYPLGDDFRRRLLAIYSSSDH